MLELDEGVLGGGRGKGEMRKWVEGGGAFGTVVDRARIWSLSFEKQDMN
jgi:hypothetical protein